MSYQNQKIGMMDEGYFVSRGEIISWLNGLLQLNLTKIEQLGSGAVYCQVIDVIHPGRIALKKVNWNAKNDYEFINNLKILQNAFQTIGIKRYVELEKLAKAKYQDNLEFAQWLKRYYDLNCGDRGNEYNGQERRGSIKTNFGFANKVVIPKTYNASGIIIPKKQENKPEKVENNLSVGPKIVKKQQRESLLGKPAAKSQQKKEEKKVSQKSAKENQQSGKLQAKKKQQSQTSQPPSQQYSKQEQYKKQLKSLEQKMMMIGQVLKSEDNSDMKVGIISQIISEQAQPQEAF